PLALGRGRRRPVGELPVALRARLALGAQRQRAARLELRHLAVDRPRREYVTEREVLVHRKGVLGERESGRRREGLQLRGPRETAPLQRDVERLDPERIACEVERAVRAIPEREREHAFEARPHRRPPLLESAQDALGVGGRPVTVTEALELGL